MATFTNDTDAPMVLPTLDPPVELQPGESCQIPDPPTAYDSTKATIAEVLAEVGADPAKAAVALAAEEQAVKPRKSLIEQLAAIVNPNEGNS